MVEEKSKENFIKAIEIIEAEQKFNMLAFAAPLVIFVAKLDLVIQIQDNFVKSILICSFVLLFLGLYGAILSLMFFRTWKAKEILFLGGKAYKGKDFFTYLESNFKPLKLELNEQSAIKVVKISRFVLTWLLCFGWLFLILSLFIVIYSDGSPQKKQIRKEVIVHTQGFSQ